MQTMTRASSIFAILSVLGAANAQSSTCPSPSGSIQPSVASGYSLHVVATGLSKPRGLAFDNQGRLLVVQQNSGIISSHAISEANGCVTAADSVTVVPAGSSLNHGIWINGTILYASSSNSVYSWDYDVAARTVSNMQELVTGMDNSDHSTRTLLLLESAPGMLVVSRGSAGNLDIDAATIQGGTAQVRAFDLNNSTGVYDWLDGELLAWGVRNEVGLGEHPTSGGIWGVENSADQINRDGVDVSNNNPGEELNFFGYLNGTPYDHQGGFFGYPWCLSVWNTSELPNSSDLSVGEQFAFDSSTDLDNRNQTDQFCADNAVDPRQVFQAHMAPIDIKFNNSGTEAWISFRGSWDRNDPVGYKLSVVHFNENGEPTEPADSLTAATDIISNMDNSVCPDNCFRPAGLAIDGQGRIFMSSDASGEIYLITRDSAANGTQSTSDSSTVRMSSRSSRMAACFAAMGAVTLPFLF